MLPCQSGVLNGHHTLGKLWLFCLLSLRSQLLNLVSLSFQQRQNYTWSIPLKTNLSLKHMTQGSIILKSRLWGSASWVWCQRFWHFCLFFLILFTGLCKQFSLVVEEVVYSKDLWTVAIFILGASLPLVSLFSLSDLGMFILLFVYPITQVICKQYFSITHIWILYLENRNAAVSNRYAFSTVMMNSPNKCFYK